MGLESVFVSGSTSWLPLLAVSLSLTLLLVPNKLILSSAPSTLTRLASFLPNGLLSFRSGDDAHARLVGVLKMDTGIAAVLVVEFFCSGLFRW